ncbi:hypothetical protein QZH41_006278 [Actinostola sp. cb2023]|nr:hypothetical protein QZH41_006278 [Actinostola sp. cb2023]
MFRRSFSTNYCLLLVSVIFYRSILDGFMLNKTMFGHDTVTARSRHIHGTVTARSRHGHGTVTARSRHGHGTVTARSRHGHGTVTARSRHGHGTVTARSRHGHGTVTARSRHGHGTVTARSRHGHGTYRNYFLLIRKRLYSNGLLDLLNKRLSKTEEVIAKEDREAAERQITSINKIVEVVIELKEVVEEKKFMKGESEEEVTAWSAQFDADLNKADGHRNELTKQIKEMDLREQEADIAIKHKKTMEFERELLEQKAEFEKGHAVNQASEIQQVSQQMPKCSAKLPKLSITKFNGKIEEWLPFWGKFTSEIDCTSLPALTKFGYLKELLEKSVRSDVDGLPFTEEGYSNAKAILTAEYGQPSEIVNVYVQNIMQLPVITGTNPKKIHDFYKQLRYNVQSLETLGKLGDVKGNVRGTLDKLKGIKADLVRGNEGWQSWNFKDLLEQLKRWRDINPAEDNSDNNNPHKGTYAAPRMRALNTQHSNQDTSQADYEELCRMDVLGLADTPSNNQDTVYEEFKEQLKRDPVGWYETGLPWKGNHPSLPNNKEGSLKRLNSIVRKLERQELLGQYDDIIKDQIAQGIVEPASEHVEGREFYIPHKPVLRETAESTKLRIVYDASARAYDNAPSLNDCLHAGPPLQNQLWSVLVRSRFHPVLITGDMRQAFLQVRVRESDRDALRFHWIADLNTRRVETFRFTRALFGLVSSPFLLGGVVQQHLEASRREHSEIVNEIQRSLYVDDLITGGSTVEEAKLIKDTATEIFDKAGFTLHKWHSNATELDPNNEQQGACETPETYAKQQLGVTQRVKGTLLGMEWNIENDTIAVKVPSERAQPTKRGLLARLSRIYDPLGFVSPTTLCGKLLYREACELKAAWDAPFPDELTRKLSKWEKMLPESVTIPRQLATQRNHITNIDLHCFGDASGQGVAAAVYAVVSQPTGVNVGLVAAKARLAKQGLTIPRLELVSGHMAVNLITNTRDALKGFPVGELQCWLDSTVALHWIRGAGEYKQFVSNRAHKIQQHKDVKWRHVSSQDNPADLGSRGGRVDKAELWWRGPEWLKDRNDWPNDIMTNTSPESQAEAKVTREVFGLAHDETDEFNVLLNKFTLWKTLRICAWISRFISNSHKSKEHRTTGPLLVEEIQRQKQFWMMRAQESVEGSEKFENDKLQLNLQASSSGLLECRGRIQGHYPIYLPDTHQYTEKLVEELHCATLHGGVGLTMAKVREHFWVPRLRRLAKKVRRNCHGCKRFQVSAYGTPPPAPLPTTRTEGTHPYQVIGVDYAGPIRYRTTRQREGKVYILLYACSLTRGIFLDLLPNLETSEFLRSLKGFIARRGRPERIYSDNAQTFVSASKWIKTVMKDEQLNDFLATQNITWQFNLSRAPWWGGQFERMVGLIKSALNKTIGNGFLWWKELEEVLLDVEVTLNNRPLSYVEEDLQLPTLTPNSMLFLNSNALPDLQPHHVESGNLRKRAKYLLKCKEAMWNRWTKEYVRHLRERHSAKATGQGTAPVIGDVVIVKSDEKNRGRWKLGVVEQLITGRDGIVRGAKIRVGKRHLERAVQHLYPLELSCDRPPAQVEQNQVVYTKAFRSKKYDGLPVHDYGADPYMIGSQVLVDILVMAKCKHFLHAESSVAALVAYFNPDIESHFLEHKSKVRL